MSFRRRIDDGDLPAGEQGTYWRVSCLLCDWYREGKPSVHNARDPWTGLSESWAKHAFTHHFPDVPGWEVLQGRVLDHAELERNETTLPARGKVGPGPYDRPDAYSEELLRKIADCYAQTEMPVVDIRRKFGVSSYAVSLARMRFNVPSRREVEAERREKAKRIARLLLEEGVHELEVVERTGLGLHTVGDIRRGLRLRPGSRSLTDKALASRLEIPE